MGTTTSPMATTSGTSHAGSELGRTRSAAVKLPASLMREPGVDKDAKARALRQLEAAGLVIVERKRGRSSVITITQERKNG
jgi:hypothetical protein